LNSAGSVRLWVVVPFLIVCGALSRGQSQARDLRFDAVSIKPHQGSSNGGSIGWQPGGRWVQVNSTIGGLIRSAYPTKVDLQAAPSWVDSEQFDVEARAAFDPNPDDRRALLRQLLAERLHFSAHYESLDRPVYRLVLAREGRVDPRLRRIDIDCSMYRPDRGAAAGNATGAVPCRFSLSGGTSLTMVSSGQTMQSFGDTISNLAGRPIVDKTGLSGYYAFTVEGLGFDDNQSIFTALQEQLGLKLDSGRAPVDVLVIDHIEKPTED
jgi:uncharacterized protein (TIGR03435 family)